MCSESCDTAAEALAIHSFAAGLGDLDERMALRTTHRRVWRGAQLLLRYLRASAEQLGLTSSVGIQVLELGSGAGWLGLNLAVALPNMRLTLSELPLAVPALRAQLARLAALYPGLAERVDVVELDWADVQSSSARHTRWDAIIGSELLYSHETLRALPRAIAALASPSTRTLYAHVPGRKASVDAALHSEFAAAGLRLQPLEAAHGPAEAPAACTTPDERQGGGGDHHGDDDDGVGAWLPDGGLFADEDMAYRASLPSAAIFDVLREP